VCILLVFSNLGLRNRNHVPLHNLKVNFDKILKICKLISTGFVNELGNVPRSGSISKFSDLEVDSLSRMAEDLSIDSKNLLFIKINYAKELRRCFPSQMGNLCRDAIMQKTLPAYLQEF